LLDSRIAGSNNLDAAGLRRKQDRPGRGSREREITRKFISSAQTGRHSRREFHAKAAVRARKSGISGQCKLIDLSLVICRSSVLRLPSPA
jgi:hypothetical protein